MDARRGGRLLSLALVAGAGAASLAAPGLARRLGRRLPKFVADKAAVGGLILMGSAVLATLEAKRPYRRDWQRADDIGDDVAKLATSVPAATAASMVVAVGGGTLVAKGLERRFGGLPWPARAPLAVRLGIALLMADFVHYWYHRVSHQNPTVWRAHAVHHTPTRLYWLNAKRVSVAEGATLGALRTLPVVAMGADPTTLLAYEVFMGIFGQLQHTNIDMDDALVNPVFSTADQHRWHHSVDPAEANGNYGAVVNLWDRLFGTYYLPAGREFTDAVGVLPTPGTAAAEPA